ncbi:hypothetical protein [Chachezhania sediminis]|uniref:hypothetical protein n=1 Tax=Chachezhania sediminis TaxID=2599291 RepID=UPI00131A8173|nr:hypothetical protein [Chachezhania sediminis]
MKPLTTEEQAAIAAFLADGGQVTRCTDRAGKEVARFEPVDPATPSNTRPGPEPRTVRQMGVREALEWAFGTEHARLSYGEGLGETGPGFGMEYILLQQAELGRRVDVSWGRSRPADDAELIAAAVQGALPRAEALWLADLARSGTTPDPLVGAVPRIVPEGWHQNQNGWRPATADAAELGPGGWRPQPRRNRKGVIVADAVRYTPCRWERTPREIGAARRRYLDWIGHLMTVLAALQHVPLTWVELTDDLPPMTPWRNSS